MKLYTGKINVNADALSRNVPATINKLGKQEATKKVYSEKEKQQILFEYHDVLTGGHQGVAHPK